MAFQLDKFSLFKSSIVLTRLFLWIPFAYFSGLALPNLLILMDVFLYFSPDIVVRIAHFVMRSAPCYYYIFWAFVADHLNFELF